MRSANSLVAERVQIVQGSVVDGATAGWTVPAINMENVLRATLCFMKAAGTAGEDPTITVQEGTGISAGNLVGGQNLAVITRVDTKRHASAIPQVYAKETQAAAATYTSLTLAEELGHVLIDFTGDDLTDGFVALKASIADVGVAAQLGVLFWIVEMKEAPPLSIQANT